jgi:hypothetical protein
MIGSAPKASRGEIITFYSYKGGTGRTMALANVACLLAERVGPKERVLVIDWDLEAPGLHRFFPPRLVKQSGTFDLGLDATPGLIDLFGSVSEAMQGHEASSEEESDDAVETAFRSVNFESFIADTDIGAVRILRAGRNDDGRYSQRVTKFDWENLFRRAPTVYRAFAERLGEMFRYVLIDSRTGVTDISGICTSLLPEKLVVVFTPNRQSLGGIRETVERATSYRRNSDDLRPLLVYPLPSRIEASIESLRKFWRFGNREQNIVGYQPMFEELLGRAYGQGQCDLSAYFEQVSIQQTPDYAYGEEIAVRRSTDRFSLGNSYRLFVDHLLSGDPPWPRPAEAKTLGVKEKLTVSAGADLAASSLQLEEIADDLASRVHFQGSRVSPDRPILEGIAEDRGPKGFLSYAREDYERVAQIAKALESHGFTIWWDRNLSQGLEYERIVTAALDDSDVIIACWSKASIASESVLVEATEGLRRGILIPVLLDDVAPPLSFREIKAIDLRRDISGGIGRLLDAVTHRASTSPGSSLTPEASSRGTTLSEVVPPTVVRREAEAAPVTRLRKHRASWFVLRGLAVVFALACAATIVLWRQPPSSSPNVPSPSIPTPTPSLVAAVAEITVPNFVGSTASDVRKARGFLGFQVVFVTKQGQESPSLEGVITYQSPAPGQHVRPGTPIRLQVASETVIVPIIVGMTLDEAILALSKVQLRLGQTTERAASGVRPGTIISQSPDAGASSAAGGVVNVIFAAPPSPAFYLRKE